MDCSVPGCERPGLAKQLCTAHYQRLRKRGDLQPDRPRRVGHGRYHTLEYRIWNSMVQRCHNDANKDFRHYGGRGITVCARWRDFRNFIADIGSRPDPSLTIERINNDGNYCPENCKWATRAEQRRNQRGAAA